MDRAPAAAGLLELHGHESARGQVSTALGAGRLAPVLLVTGPRGVGKETFGFWVARLLLCAAPEGRPCGRCSSCLKVLRLQHPDVHWFFPVPSESSFTEADWGKLLERIREDPLEPRHVRFSQPASFRMHQAATIRHLAATKPFEAGGRVFVLGDYEQNPSDQVHNALLKVLEEPPPRTTFVLTSARPQGLPPTILSRCRQLRLAPVASEVVESFLEAVAERRGEPLGAARRRDVAARSEGRPGVALELLPEKEQGEDDPADVLREALRGGPLASYQWALTTGFRGSREEHGRRLDALGALWRDLLRVKAGVLEGIVRPDLLELYREAAERLDPRRAADAALEIERAREQVQANAYAPLAFWRLFRTLATALEPAAPARAS
ncbi:MAG: ATP-binding protein [Gemmatimonadota bacterium]